VCIPISIYLERETQKRERDTGERERHRRERVHAQSGVELILWLKLALNTCSSYLYLTNAGIIGTYHCPPGNSLSFYLAVLGIELRALCLLGKCSST
jgi:hypothetical protein